MKTKKAKQIRGAMQCAAPDSGVGYGERWGERVVIRSKGDTRIVKL